MKGLPRAVLLATTLACAGTRAEARVVFTGYGDLRHTSTARVKVSGSPATLKSLGLSAGALEARSFSADAIGLFATTQVKDDLQFQFDLDFRSIGNDVGRVAMPYAYLDWTPRPGTALQGGKLLLPFGYYNESRFYAFQRHTVVPPVFQSAILGLPMADWGVAAKQRLEGRALNAEAAAYVVNGYGNSATNRTGMRLASVPGGLSLAGNVRASDNNHKPSVGARLRLMDLAGLPVETGASWYWGAWDSSGLEPMALAGAHLRARLWGVDLLLEGLHLAVRGDQGFARSIGSPNWSTLGGFGVASYEGFSLGGKPVVPYLQAETYRTRPNDGGAARETVRSLSTGASVGLAENLRVKAEYFHLSYELPDAATSGSLRLDVDGAVVSVVVTY